MTTVAELYDRLVEGLTGHSVDAGIRSSSWCQPSGGVGTRVMPPTYPGGYVSEDRVLENGEVKPVIQLDSYQSQANRIEEALLEARDDGRIELPLFEMRINVDPWNLRLTSLDFPHRYADAYLRDSMIDGVRFDKTAVGGALRVAQPTDAAAVYRYDPGSLVFGAWNSHRNGRQPKFSRAYRSETLGINFQVARRKGGRLDPYNLTGAVDDSSKKEADWMFVVGEKAKGEKAKGKRLSEMGHGNALSGEESPGGVTVTEVRRLAFVSFAQLARLRFGIVDAEAQVAGRAALAALAVVGDRLAFDRAGLVFRSGCELTVIRDEVAWEKRGGLVEPFELNVGAALELFLHARERADAAGLIMGTDTIVIEPIEELRKAIGHAFISADVED
ncbi:MAG: type I-G CRISPR-associated RAMP protein Csb1/Cas7g [Acidimicrobiales bacterium]